MARTLAPLLPLSFRLGVGGLALLSALTCLGQPVAIITGPTEATPGDLVILRTEGSVGSGHTWLILPAEASGSFLPLITVDGSQAAVFASSRPGTYIFVLAVAQADQAAVTAHTLRQGQPPPPVPDPDDPDPPGPEPPVETAMNVVVVYDENTVTPQQAEVIAQARAQIDRLIPIHFYALDIDDVDEDGRRVADPYIAAAGIEPPLFLIYGKTAILKKGKLPATAKELMDALHSP